jgi:hypothetical protein
MKAFLKTHWLTILGIILTIYFGFQSQIKGEKIVYINQKANSISNSGFFSNLPSPIKKSINDIQVASSDSALIK